MDYVPKPIAVEIDRLKKEMDTKINNLISQVEILKAEVNELKKKNG